MKATKPKKASANSTTLPKSPSGKTKVLTRGAITKTKGFGPKKVASMSKMSKRGS